MPVRAAAPVLAMLLAAGCGASESDSHPSSQPAQQPEPIEARRTVDAFLYSPPQPASVCPRLWVEAPKPQSQCAFLLRRLKVARARHVSAPPKRGTMQYRLGGVSGKIVTIEAGDRQPTPAEGPSFYGAFVLERAGSGWRILRFEF